MTKNILVLTLCVFTSIFSYSQTITASQVFYVAPANSGDLLGTWLFQDADGNRMSITIWKPAPSTFFNWHDSVVWSYDKNPCPNPPIPNSPIGKGYWQPGICNAHLDFVLTQQPDGSFVSTESLMNFPLGCPYSWCTSVPMTMTVDVSTPPGMPTPYLIIPASATTGQTVTVDTAYLSAAKPGVLTFDALSAPISNNTVHWQTRAYIETVYSSVYYGPALVSEQFEGSCFNPDGSYNPQSIGCAHEKWYFAPGWGLVMVVPLNDGSGEQNFNPRKIMVRI